MATELCRKHGLSSATYYAWKAKLGGLEVSDAKRLLASPGDLLRDERQKLPTPRGRTASERCRSTADTRDNQLSSQLTHNIATSLRGAGSYAKASRYGAPSLPVFAKVQIAEPVAPAPQPAPCSSGLIQMALPHGARVRVVAGMDAGVLAWI